MVNNFRENPQPNSQFLDYIRAQGYRVTPQRRIVIDTLTNCGGHATAVTIYNEVCKQMPAINQATVYRTLEFFCNLGLTTKTEISGRVVYEVIGEKPHHHLVCRQCGHIEDLADEHFAALTSHLLTEHGFRAEINHFAISGLCVHCADQIDQA